MSTSVEGLQVDWSGERDEYGYRTFTITHLVKSDLDDGPFTVLNTAGLPVPGDLWSFGNDVDMWAWCRPNAKVKRHSGYGDGEAARYWLVEQTFSTKPPERDDRGCQDTPIEDPLLEPAKINGTINNKTFEATYDRHNVAILNSAHEPVRGKQVEFDGGEDTIEIEQNIPILNLPLLKKTRNTLNNAPLWGLPARCIKLSNYTWERKFFGQCSLYYVRKLKFDTSTRLLADKQSLSSAAVATSGALYAVGNILQLAGGTFVTAATIIVTGIGNNGTLASFSIANGGEYTTGATPSNPVTLTALEGSGINATLNATWGDALVSGFDRDLLDEGTKVLHGRWASTGKWTLLDINGVPPDPENPQHFDRFTDRNGNPARVLLDGSGRPALVQVGTGTDVDDTTEQGKIHVEYYRESDFLLLGIPTSF